MPELRFCYKKYDISTDTVLPYELYVEDVQLFSRSNERIPDVICLLPRVFVQTGFLPHSFFVLHQDFVYVLILVLVNNAATTVENSAAVLPCQRVKPGYTQMQYQIHQLCKQITWLVKWVLCFLRLGFSSCL